MNSVSGLTSVSLLLLQPAVSKRGGLQRICVGVASWTPPAPRIGNRTASATYSGDASFNASSSKSVTFSVTKGQPWLDLYVQAPYTGQFNVNVGGSLTLTAVVGPSYGSFRTGLVGPLGTVGPTGTVTICLQSTNAADACLNPIYFQTVTLTPPSGTNAQSATATVTFTNLAAGLYLSSFIYNGDANWQSWGGLLPTMSLSLRLSRQRPPRQL
jgi:hypothetical protein